MYWLENCLYYNSRVVIYERKMGLTTGELRRGSSLRLASLTATCEADLVPTKKCPLTLYWKVTKLLYSIELYSSKKEHILGQNCPHWMLFMCFLLFSKRTYLPSRLQTPNPTTIKLGRKPTHSRPQTINFSTIEIVSKPLHQHIIPTKSLLYRLHFLFEFIFSLSKLQADKQASPHISQVQILPF